MLNIHLINKWTYEVGIHSPVLQMGKLRLRGQIIDLVSHSW